MISFYLCLFLLLRLLEWSGRAPVWASSWGDDLICLPLVLGGILLVQRRLPGRGAHFTLPLGQGLAVLVGFSLYFEFLAPLLGTGAVADPRDLLAYAAGFLLFQFIQNRPGGLRPACS